MQATYLIYLWTAVNLQATVQGGCVDGFYGYQCTLICYTNNCQRCERDSGRCSTCKAGFYLHPNGICYPCSNEGCLCTYSNPQECSACKQGYYKNGYYCYICSSKCISCTNSNTCYGCIAGYYVQYKQYAFNYYSYECSQCIDNCITCTDRDTCNACKSGYHGPLCQPNCLTNCATCTSQTECQSCKEGFYGTQCDNPCSINCRTCTDSNKCNRCVEGYYLKYQYYDSYFCRPCIDNCLSCTNETTCNVCKTGYHGSLCQPHCLSNCATCTSLTECQSCEEGFYGPQCGQTCPVNCRTCTSQGSCLACKEGNFGTTCQIRCPAKCVSCNTAGTCSTCKHGFSRPDKECQCLVTLCTSPECISCANSNYYAEGSSCCPCNSNCKNNTCTSANQCTDGCKDGFLGPKCEFECTQIDLKCSVCSGSSLESSVCERCSNGYYLDTNRTCVQCSALCVDGHCSISNGHCEKGCTNGFWNSRCDRNCSKTCTVCSHYSGDCLTCSLTSVFGANCDLPCSNTCMNVSCHMNGTCTSGCISDYYGPSCEECPTNCARSGNGTRCYNATGLCMYGCNEGFKGEGCREALMLDNSKATVPAAAIGGGVAAVVIVALVVVVGLFIFFRRRTHGPKNETISVASNNASNSSVPVYALVTRREKPVSVYENTSSVNTNNPSARVHNPVYTNSRLDVVSSRDDNAITTEDSLEIDELDSIARQNAIIFEEKGGVYYNNNEKVKTLKIPVAELQTIVISKNMDYFKKEFEKLPYGLLKEYRVSQMKANIGKNRYKGIYPYDDYRVKVRGGDTDYINASFIDGYKRQHEYIAALGPMSKQLGDFATFWRMVWQQNVEKIVMVTNLVEEQKDKCEKYWPSVGSTQMYGDIQVFCQSEDEYAEFTRRTFDVIKDKETWAAFYQQILA